MKLGILGTGNMAEAIIAGLSVRKSIRIIGYDVNRKKLQYVRRRYRIKTSSSVKDLMRKADAVLLAVKPQQIASLLNTVQPFIRKKHLILSIAAGIDTRFIEKQLGRGTKIIRLMPNTPAMTGLGATVFYANRFCKKKDKKITKTIFESVGIVEEVKKETLLDAVTGLSGSGPAYLYSFVDAMIEGGKQAGLKSGLATKLAIQTALGAANLLKNTGTRIDRLIAQVISKRGTTEAGLKVLKQRKFKNIVVQCIRATTRRARELRTSN